MADYFPIAATGVIVPDFSTTLQNVKNRIWQMNGWADIDLSAETPQGAIAMAFALVEDAVTKTNAFVANQINPDLATEIFLDALASFLDCKRKQATASIVYGVTLTGEPNTYIQAGSMASDGTNEFKLISSVILDLAGNGLGDFQSVKLGAIVVPIGALNLIGTSVLGWETVNNTTTAILGLEEETDLRLRRRRENTLALQGSESVESVVSALYDLQDVNSLSFLENYTSNTHVIDGITLKPHSMYFCIDGGKSEDIAKALKSKRGIGSGYNGSESYTITDEYSNQPYTILFDRPRLINLYFRVTVKTSIVNATIIPKLLENVLRGNTVSSIGLAVGEDVSPFELSAGINEQEPRFIISNLEISDDSGASWSNSNYNIAIDELGVSYASFVSVVVS